MRVSWPLAAGLFLVLAISGNARAKGGVEIAGDILQYALPTTAYVMTAYNHDSDGAVEYTEAAGLTLGATYTLKYSINEERPDGGAHSFPSGHTSISFSAAEFVRKRYGAEYGAALYLAAAFVGYSRVEAKRHYIHDVIAGGVIGTASSYLFTSPWHGWRIRIQAADGCYGLVASWAW